MTIPDPNDGTTNEPRDMTFGAALDRIIKHAVSHGEVYAGAVDDLKVVDGAVVNGEVHYLPNPAP